MIDMDGALDFDSDDLLRSSPVSTKKRKKKVIGLDDLLTDFYKEKSKIIEREAKKAKSRKNYSSDEDEDFREAELFKCVDKCQQQMGEISGDDDIHHWGLQIFSNQRTPPPLVFPELGNCVLLNSFMNNEVNSLVELNTEKGETFLKSLLGDGWLLKLVRKCGRIEGSIAMWAFNLMLYSSKEMLRTSACDFWCAILSPKNEIKIDWLPNCSELKGALSIYGFLWDSPSNSLSSMEMVHHDSDQWGPPQNIRAWIKYVAACFKVRSKFSIFSIREAEDFLSVIIYLFLDRQLLGLSAILYECMLSAISFFTDNEWNTCCGKVATSLGKRVPKDVNCLRAVESISGVDTRSKQLRSAVAFQILVTCFDKKVTNAEKILELLISINVKDRNSDLFKVYIYLVLFENWIILTPTLEDKPVISEMWGLFLRNCLCQITSTDMRPYASKVRSKASYLLQGCSTK